MLAKPYHLTAESQNIKTGNIPVSTSSRATCPDACPLKGKGCYAEDGKLKLHWDRVDAAQYERSVDLDGLAEFIRALPEGQVWRHNQAGDLPGVADEVDGAALATLAAANRGRRGYTYTHKPVKPGSSPFAASNLEAIRAAVAEGFTVNLSANNAEEADELAALGLPVVCIVPEDAPRHTVTPGGRAVVTCPAQLSDDVVCGLKVTGKKRRGKLAGKKACGLCQVASPLRPIVGFQAHGTHKRTLQVALRVI